MKKLISSSEAADILGLSLQGIHYRIKKGQLESLKKDGKTYVYLDQDLIVKKEKPSVQTNATIKHNETQVPQQTSYSIDNFQQIALKSKDEQIAILKQTIKLMRKQYRSEIHRLDKNNKQTLKVFQSEVELLKSAFSEMKNIYQVEHKTQKQSKQQTRKKPHIKDDFLTPMEFMDIKDFFFYMKQYNKTDLEIKSLILDRIKNEDKRFIYKKDSKEVLIYKSDFLDLI